MAATLGSQKIIMTADALVEESYYTTLVPGVTVTHSHIGPSGYAPFKVEMVVTERPTSRDVMWMAWDESANDLSSDTVALQFDTVVGGDLAGAQAKVLLYWREQGSGGLG
jgi:hypothetical protein